MWMTVVINLLPYTAIEMCMLLLLIVAINIIIIINLGLTRFTLDREQLAVPVEQISLLFRFSYICVTLWLLF